MKTTGRSFEVITIRGFDHFEPKILKNHKFKLSVIEQKKEIAEAKIHIKMQQAL